MTAAEHRHPVRGTVAAATRLVDSARARVEDTVVWRSWERLLENEFIDRAVALGAKAFVSFFPFLVVATAFVTRGVRNSVIRTLSTRFGLRGASADAVRQAFGSSTDVRRATGVLGLILLVFYATSFTTALHRAYSRAWRRPRTSAASGRLRGPVWLAGVMAFAALLGALRSVLSGPATVAYLVVATAGSVALWWASAWLLLLGQVRWRPLLVAGLVTGVGMSIYAATSNVWMPVTITNNQNQFGFFGVAMALVTWFTGAAAIVVAGACISATVADEEGVLGRLSRGPSGSALAPGAEPPLPPPAGRARLVQALGTLGAGPAGGEPDDG